MGTAADFFFYTILCSMMKISHEPQYIKHKRTICRIPPVGVKLFDTAEYN